MSELHDWLVQIPDHPDVQEERVRNLSAHLTYNKPQITASQLVVAGPLLAEHPKKAGDAMAITGSLMIFRAGDEEGVWELIKGNPYAKVGVWNLEKTVVTPFKCAVRTPL